MQGFTKKQIELLERSGMKLLSFSVVGEKLKQEKRNEFPIIGKDFFVQRGALLIRQEGKSYIRIREDEEKEGNNITYQAFYILVEECYEMIGV